MKPRKSGTITKVKGEYTKALIGEDMMLGNRSPWLGQVSLVQRPWMGNIAEKFPTPPADAKSPANGCLFIGGRSPFDPGTVDARIKDAQALGYTDIKELDVPPCDPAKDFFQCAFVGGNPPFKYVWACPGNRVSPEAAAPAPSSTAAPAASASAQPASPSSGTALAVGGGIAAAGLLAFLAFR